MKKTLTLALCLTTAGAALAQGTSASSVTIYGLIDAAVRHSNNTTASGGKDTLMEDGIFTGTRLGFRGREDLGGGAYASFVLESGFDVSTGASLQGNATADYGYTAAATRFWGRQVFLTLGRNGVGSVSLGRQYTIAHSLAARFQPQGNPNSTMHSLFSSHHIPRQDNVVRFDTKLAGVDLAASYTFGERPGDSKASSAVALGAGYSAGALQLGGYVQHMKNLTGSETRKIVGLGGNYKVSKTVTAFAGLMTRRSDGSAQKNRAFTLGANVDVTPQVTLSAAYYDDQQSGSTALDGSRKMGWVTANYRFSRRTDVYAVIGSNEVDGGYAKPAFMGTKGSQNNLVLGLRHTF